MNELRSVWQVPLDHPAFAGHFPGRPIVPGVLLLDHALRLAQAQTPGRDQGWTVSQAKFLSPVGPGEALDFVLTPAAGGACRFVVRAGPRDVASGSLMPPAA
jgi:3-hydroxyacyl-[acyl-carrier-protein] dehydratase